MQLSIHPGDFLVIETFRGEIILDLTQDEDAVYLAINANDLTVIETHRIHSENRRFFELNPKPKE